ncbi:MAG: SUMF1/EgtB/PvdO family nonheme iron enzyme [Planctomycetes bacterium]|nr:SUMF1/EgtB/PvdO family nonheme iron enzyme [Planctomycetota bacterium]
MKLTTRTIFLLNFVLIPFIVAEEKIHHRQFASSSKEIRTSLRLAITSIEKSFPDRYKGEEYLEKLDKMADQDLGALKALQKKALLANPIFETHQKIVAIKRKGGDNHGFRKGNYNSITGLPRSGWENEILVIHNAFGQQPESKTLFKQKERKGLILDIDLHFSGKKMAFTLSDGPDSNAFRVVEYDMNHQSLRQITPNDGNDVDHSDPCYLPDGGLIFSSTATYLGMPCISGNPRMASFYRMDGDGKNVRQLGFDQDTSWYPTMLADGRVMYVRWDYSDMVHSNNRPLMVMRPDGSGQKSIAFTNSYFPASYFFVRPLPGHPSRLVGIATGHHGASRSGMLLIVDPAKGYKEDAGVIQQIPGYNKKVKGEATDPLGSGVWNAMIHPFPLAEDVTHKGSGEFFLVSMKAKGRKTFGIYLVDIYDNVVEIIADNTFNYFEPIPLKKRPTPPIIPSQIDPSSKTAHLYIQDIYQGPGLKGVPKGTVKSLRIGSYQFSAHKSHGGNNGAIGIDTGWDIKTIIGEVPVEKDGSISCVIPSQTPLFFQPLDDAGRSLQGMRSWATAMGGESMSCVGCHEAPHQAPIPKPTKASLRAPSSIKPWLGTERPISFNHEIQPILNAKCISCHDGKPANGRYTSLRSDLKDLIPDFSGNKTAKTHLKQSGSTKGTVFPLGYLNLMPYVYRPGIESPMEVPVPCEFGATVSELTTILKKGHYGVQLNQEEWQRLYLWMDTNAPYTGYRRQITKSSDSAFKKGNELSQKYAGIDTFVHLEIPQALQASQEAIPNQKALSKQRQEGHKSFSAHTKKVKSKSITIEIAPGHNLDLKPIPAGDMIMGSSKGALDELPMHKVEIKKSFWMSSTEITNAQFRLFKADHDSGYVDRLGYQFGQKCIPANDDSLPVIRVSPQETMAFCRWLSKKSGHNVTLPTEVQWEWAARAGQGGDFFFSSLDSDFSAYANLADISMEGFAEDTSHNWYQGIRPIANPDRFTMWIPYLKKVNDKQQIQCAPAQYKANPWGLYDMHGNVSEWTRSIYQAYPKHSTYVHGKTDQQTELVARGGSWHDRPYRATASYRHIYRSWQKVHDVGFRIVVEP